MDARKKQMLLILIVWARVYIPYLLTLWKPLPDNPAPKKADIKANT